MPKEPGEGHDENFYEQEDKAAANIGRDDVPLKEPNLRQGQDDDLDHRDKEAMIDMDADDLFKEAKQEGLIKGSQDEYAMIYKYVRYGQPNTEQEKDFFSKLERMEAELEKRKEQGEK